MGGCASKPKNLEGKILETDELLATQAPAIDSIEEEPKTCKSEVLINDKVSENKEEEAKGSESEKDKAKGEQVKESAMVIGEGEEVKVKEEINRDEN